MKGTKIKLKRIEMGMAQYELAEKVDYGVNMINKVENRKLKPSLKLLRKICKVLDLSVIEVLQDLEMDKQ